MSNQFPIVNIIYIVAFPYPLLLIIHHTFTCIIIKLLINILPHHYITFYHIWWTKGADVCLQ